MTKILKPVCLMVILALVLSVAAIALPSPVLAQPLEVWVDDDAAPGWYDATHLHTIQEGIDAVAIGGTVHVLPGKYDGGIIVNKPNLTIKSTDGAAETIIDPVTQSGFGIMAEGVTIEGFTITDFIDSGIKLLANVGSAHNCLIKNNIIINNGHGIWIETDDNTISGNEICDNLGDGIHLGSFYRHVFIDNDGSDSNTFIDDLDGLDGSNSNQIIDNYIHGNWHGIFIEHGNNNTIRYNTITENVWAPASGIHVDGGIDNFHPDNETNNLHIDNGTDNNHPIDGISSGNVANCNNIYGNGPYGVYNAPDNPRFDATKNWWGSASGPSTSPGTGDPISTNVDYKPYLPDEFQLCPECVPPTGVGGEAYPVSKLVILALWIGLAVLLIGGITWFTLRRRKAYR